MVLHNTHRIPFRFAQGIPNAEDESFKAQIRRQFWQRNETLGLIPIDVIRPIGH